MMRIMQLKISGYSCVKVPILDNNLSILGVVLMSCLEGD